MGVIIGTIFAAIVNTKYLILFSQLLFLYLVSTIF